MIGERRSIGQMPLKRRQQGLCGMERHALINFWRKIIELLTYLVAAVANGAHAGGFLIVNGLVVVQAMIAQARAAQRVVWAAHSPIDRANCDRRVNSFTEEECWRMFRFRKADLPRLINRLGIPYMFEVKGGRNGFCYGEYAMLYTMFRLSYPRRLIDNVMDWGRDYSELSKIFNTCLDYLYDQHRGKVVGNVAWYQDRFDLYNQKISQKVAANPTLPVPGQIPANLEELFGFLDCTANEICRPVGPYAIQNAFWNRYHHGHYIIWQGVSFPDGMVVMEGPEPGFQTDTMVWRDCLIRNQLEAIMQSRQAEVPQRRRLKLYADKIYNNCVLVRAAWNRRHGNVLPWMTNENSIMSKIRVAIEWTFGTIVMLYKFVDFCKCQKMRESPVEKHYVVAVLLANCHNCEYADEHLEYFDCEPPTMEDYLNQ
jgi:hypothetical protein